MYKIAAYTLITLLVSGCDLASDINASNIKGYSFNLHEVQKYCTVKRQGDKYLAIKCELPKLKPVTTSCEGLMSAGLRDPKFLCSGGLWMLSDQCYVEMLDTQQGNIKCRKPS